MINKSFLCFTILLLLLITPCVSASDLMVNYTFPRSGITDSDNQGAGTEGWRVQNENTADGWQGNNDGSWVKLDYGAGVTHKIHAYNITQGYVTRTYDIKDWRWEGSTDNTNWFLLDIRTGQTFVQNVNLTFPFAQVGNVSDYRYYRIYAEKSDVASNPIIGELQLYNKGTPYIDTTPPGSITALTNTTANCGNITWTWTNPGGSLNTDYSHLYSLKNDAWIGNYSNTSAAATWLSLTNNTQYTMSTKTVDLTGNVNTTWVNATSTTAVCSAVTPTPTPTPTPAPTAAPGTQWCGLKTIYFDNTATLPVGYESLNTTLPEHSEVVENVTVINTGGEVLIDSYISPQGLPGVTYIETGTEIHHMYAYVSNAGGVTRFNITMFTRDITGVETLRYQGYSADIDNLAVLEVKTNIAHARLYMADTDRIVVKIYAVTDSAAAKQLYWIYQGTSHASYIESAYYNCIVPTTTTPIPTWQPEINPTTDHKTDPWSLVKEWWWLPVTLAAFMIIFGRR